MYFNPRSHEGSDVTSPSAQLFLLYFNPRSHEGSDDSLYGIFQSRPQFQSTLPRRERHSWKTFLMVSFPFQSTLPRRERPVTHSMRAFFIYFNPRSHEGSDTFRVLNTAKVCLFQSTLPRRERRVRVGELSALKRFQSTLPRRERH